MSSDRAGCRRDRANRWPTCSTFKPPCHTSRLHFLFWSPPRPGELDLLYSRLCVRLVSWSHCFHLRFLALTACCSVYLVFSLTCLKLPEAFVLPLCRGPAVFLASTKQTSTEDHKCFLSSNFNSEKSSSVSRRVGGSRPPLK